MGKRIILYRLKFEIHKKKMTLLLAGCLKGSFNEIANAASAKFNKTRSLGGIGSIGKNII